MAQPVHTSSRSADLPVCIDPNNNDRVSPCPHLGTHAWPDVYPSLRSASCCESGANPATARAQEKLEGPAAARTARAPRAFPPKCSVLACKCVLETSSTSAVQLAKQATPTYPHPVCRLPMCNPACCRESGWPSAALVYLGAVLRGDGSGLPARGSRHALVSSAIGLSRSVLETRAGGSEKLARDRAGLISFNFETHYRNV